MRYHFGQISVEYTKSRTGHSREITALAGPFFAATELGLFCIEGGIPNLIAPGTLRIVGLGELSDWLVFAFLM